MAVRTPYTPLYGDVLDYLERSGLPSVGGIFDDYDESKNPFIIDFEESTSSDDLDKTVAPIIQATRGGGGDFSVYNPDPNRTRTQDNYSPYNYRQAAERNLIGTTGGALTGTQIPNTKTEVAKLMDMYPEYYRGKQLTGIPGAIASYAKNSLVGQGLGALGNMLPINKTAILQNELLGSGFQLNDIGQIVGDPRTVEGVMAGMNTSKMDAGSFDKKSAGIESTLSGKYGLSKSEIDSIKAGNITDSIKAKAYNKTMGTTSNLVQDLLNTEIAKNKFLDVIDKTTTVFDDQSLAKDPTYQSFDDLVAAGLLAGDDDDDDDDYYEFNPLDIVTKQNKYYNPYEVGLISAEQQRAKLKEIQRQKDIQDAIEKEKSKPGAATFNSKTTSGGVGTYDPGKDNSGDGGYGNTGGDSYGDKSGSRSRDNRSSDLGFSDIRLKENVELIGKSPSNINIYKFNYKDNSTTYQGAMAHEVPWASVKHSNGYMMVDYSKLDVQFKKL